MVEVNRVVAQDWVFIKRRQCIITKPLEKALHQRLS